MPVPCSILARPLEGGRLRGIRALLIGLATTAGVIRCADRACQAQDASPARAWLADRLEEFQEYNFDCEGVNATRLTMSPQSILNWSNPERGTDQGALFLWTHDGHPQMIACAFEWKGVKHEFHSLSEGDIVATRRGEPVHRFGPGVAWRDVPGADSPARTRALRLTQMRRIAERFRVTVGHKDWAQTRLLSQPVFRLPESAGEDGGVFVFVQGTDPECVLLLETSKTAGWRYALARQSKFGLKAEFDGRLVWDREPNHRPKTTPQTPFLVLEQEANPRPTPIEQ